MNQLFIENDYFEILTENGFRDFSGVLITENQPLIEIEVNNENLKCTPNHKIKINNEFIEAKTLPHKIIENDHVFDLTDVDGGNHYLTNNITSHNCIIIDEAAHVDNWEYFFTSVYPTITSGKTTKLILISTPNGLNHFWEFWSNSEKELNDFKRILVKWDKVPGRDQEWKNHTLATLNYNNEKFDQEYNCGWLGSSGTLIAGWRLKQLNSSLPIVDTTEFKQYKLPEKTRVYALVADNAEGKGLDYSAFQIFDITEMPYEQVAVYRCNTINAIDYSEVIYRSAKLYNNAIVLLELNFLGEQIAYNLKWELEYENLLHTVSKGRNGKQITFTSTRNVDKGIKTTSTVKSLGCAILKLLVEQMQITIYDKETISELSTFSKKGGSYQAESGKHDDLVMCLVLFAWLTDQQYFTELTDIKTMENLKEHTSEELNDQMSIFGYITDDSSFEGTVIPTNNFLNTPEEKENWLLNF